MGEADGIEKYRVLHLKPVRFHGEIKLATKYCGPRVVIVEYFYMRGYLKGEIYEPNLHSFDELQNNIRTTVETTEVSVFVRCT
jgi:hypothetical protein